MNKEELINSWKKFAEDKDFELNPDKKNVDFAAEGILRNEEKYGLKLCPCRLRDGTKEKDLELICPCKFKSQDSWKEKDQCWCGLFIKKK